MDLEFWVVVLRVANAFLWTILGLRTLAGGLALNPLARKLIATVLIFGMWILVVGGLTPFGFPTELARTIYTIFAAYAGLIALALVTGQRDD